MLSSSENSSRVAEPTVDSTRTTRETVGRPRLGHRPRVLGALGLMLILAAALWVRFGHEAPHASPRSRTPAEIEQRAKEQPGNVEAQLEWAEALRQQERLDQAGQVLAKAVEIAPNDGRPYTGMALICLAQQQPLAAVGFFHEALKRDPNNATVWKGLASVCERVGRTEEAMSAYEKVSLLTPNDPLPWRQLGLLYTRQGQTFRGYSKLQKAVTLNPSDVLAQRFFGENAFLQGKFREAQEAFGRVVAAEPNDAVALSVLAQIGVLLDPTPGGLKKAEQQATRSLEIHPSGGANLALGQVRMARREYVPAIQALQEAIALDPDLMPAYISLSQAYSRTGQTELARKTDRLHEAALARHARVSSGKQVRP